MTLTTQKSLTMNPLLIKIESHVPDKKCVNAEVCLPKRRITSLELAPTSLGTRKGEREKESYDR